MQQEVSITQRAELTCLGIFRLQEPSSSICHVLCQVGRATLTARSLELDHFVRSTFNRDTANPRRHQPTHEISEWRDAVHPDPEAWQFTGADEDPVCSVNMSLIFQLKFFNLPAENEGQTVQQR